MDVRLNEEQEMIRQSVRELARDKIAPRAGEIDATGEFPWDVVELYRETGNVAYRDLAAQFVEQRGHGLAGDSGFGHRYLQDHLSVRERTTEVGQVVKSGWSILCSSAAILPTFQRLAVSSTVASSVTALLRKLSK